MLVGVLPFAGYPVIAIVGITFPYRRRPLVELLRLRTEWRGTARWVVLVCIPYSIVVGVVAMLLTVVPVTVASFVAGVGPEHWSSPSASAVAIGAAAIAAVVAVLAPRVAAAIA